MPYARSLLAPPDTPGFYHCVSRCVRRAWLCGLDPYTGRSFEHRRQWVEDRIHALAGILAVAIYGYAVMSNHLHLVVHVDPATAREWKEEEVARRWASLFPVPVDDSGVRAQQQRALLSNPDRLAECRRRLGSLSWFMRCLNEPIARRANREDQCTGRFWEGRFKCQALLDERAVLAAMTYVDLNPVRAGIARRLDRSKHTSIARRIGAATRRAQSDEEPLQPIAGRTTVRALSVRAVDYIELVDWTGRQFRPDKPCRIAPQEPRALERLGMDAERWNLHVRGVGSGYWRAVGAVAQLLDRAAAIQQRWLKGVGLARVVRPA